MEKEPLIMIKLMIDKYTNQLSQETLKILNEDLSKRYPGINVKLKDTEIYWKFPNLMICYMGVYYDKTISVYDILKCLTTSDFWYDKEENEEEAIWDLQINGGSLINKNIAWAHFYTWR